ncbi:MAG: Bax inhibitor-1/YccA family protein [Verrucomicrobiota bacterium]|nr:Bax inhibitor-1/YccA family protein [Verrucomicrobiota bacterium]
MRTSNPTLRSNTFLTERAAPGAAAMTIRGTIARTAILLLLAASTAGFTWQSARTGMGAGLAIGGAIGGFVIVLILCFKHSWAPVLAPLYALLEGLFLGAVSAIFESAYNGIVLQAIALTFGTLCALLGAYVTGIIRATENFKLGVFAATGGIALVYLVSLGLGLFGINIPLIHESGPVGIAFSVFVVIIAALNLVLDFDFIENGEAAGAPRYMEWYAAFGLMVTLVWLYIEFLRLLSKLRR